MRKFIAFRREIWCSSFFCYILTDAHIYFKTKPNLSYPVFLPVVGSDEWLCEPTKSAQRLWSAQRLVNTVIWFVPKVAGRQTFMA